MEVLQTSALPLGDGAVRDDDGLREDNLRRACQPNLARARLPTFANRLRWASTVARLHSPARRWMERETGFEPATSTLARSHSTTELFPLATNVDHTVAVRGGQETAGHEGPPYVRSVA